MTRKPQPSRRVLILEALENRWCPSTLPHTAPLAQPDAATQARLGAAYGQLPLSFERNQGQMDATVNFLARGRGYTLSLTPTAAVLGLPDRNAPDGGPSGSGGDLLTMQLVGANSGAQALGLDRLSGISNYLVGSDPSQWHTGIVNYGRVEFADVYPGTNLVYYGNQQQLEYDFVVAPGANPGAIKLTFQGAKDVALDSQGNLVLSTAGGDVVEHAPVLYQERQGVRQAVVGRYVLEGQGQVRFDVGPYDATRPLVIDPVYSLVYSTYLGGKTGDDGYGIAVDSAGNAYITGDTSSNNFPTRNPLQARFAGPSGSSDAFVAKLNAAGSALVYSTYLGGNGFDRAQGIAVNAAGEAYVIGETSSANFPTRNAFQAADGGSVQLMDAFLVKLNATGSALLYSTYLGGSNRDSGYAIAVDGPGNAYVTGMTGSVNFPTRNALQPVKLSPNDGNHADAFVARVDPSQVGTASLVYATYLDGSNFSFGLGIAADGLGNAYVTGRTGSIDFPTTPGALQTAFAGGINDGFVAKINAAGSALVYSTYLGGSGDDRPYGIALDGSGNALVTGYTASTTFPTANALQSALRGPSDAFVTKVSADGSALVYSTYLGGSGGENQTSDAHAGGIAVDALGNAFVTGNTSSTDFPVTAGVFQTTYGGSGDAFVTQLNPAGSAFVYSAYLGGSDREQAFGIAVDSSGNAYVTGTTQSTNFPTTNALQPRFDGHYDGFVTKIDPPAATSALAGSPPAAGAPMGPAVVSVAARFISPEVTGAPPSTVATLLAGAVNEPAFQTQPFDRFPLPTFRPQPAPWPAPLVLRQDVAPRPATHGGRREAAPSGPNEVMDAAFARGDSFADVLAGDQARTATKAS